MASAWAPRILCVDDEKNVLDGLARTLRNLYSVETAVGGEQGLLCLSTGAPFAVIVSDLRMPKMTGVEFLSHARKAAPDTVRVLLTGQADVEAAISAVNDGNIFRFLTKPCPTELLLKSLAAAVEQHRLVTSERVLLEQTLRGSVKTLTEILALANPAAFGRATRVQHAVSEMMAHFEIRERWPVEVAAMLSQIGSITLPPKTQEKLYRGQPVSQAEQEMIDRMPRVVEQLLAHIPRLDLVREILLTHNRHFNTAPKHLEITSGEPIPWGARALKIALDFDSLESEQNTAVQAFDVLRSRVGWYDPAILEGFAELRGNQKSADKICELPLHEILVGMIFGGDVKSAKGLLLIARGQEVTLSLLERIHNISPELGIREPIRMIIRNLAPHPKELAPMAR